MRVRGCILVMLAFAAAGCSSEAEDAVRRMMKDPDATQFRDVRVCSEDRDVTHGEFNAKNSYGAYVGFEPFYYAGDGVAFVGDDQFTELMKRCFGKYYDAAQSDPVLTDLEEARNLARDAAEAAADAAEAAADAVR